MHSSKPDNKFILSADELERIQRRIEIELNMLLDQLEEVTEKQKACRLPRHDITAKERVHVSA